VEEAPAASYPSIPPTGYEDPPGGGAYPAYPGDQGGYQEPAYHAAPPSYPAPVAAGYPEAGYPEDGGYGDEYAGQTAYADAYGNAGYAPGYPAADYPADHYGQDGYDGYPADQG
jgi:hypothetical protein